MFFLYLTFLAAYPRAKEGRSYRARGCATAMESIEVKLYATWSSSFCKRVELALKLKGISYDYIEEDLSNKSQAFLQYNPIHKKVPLLVHNGKSIAESLTILEYIDEQWKNAPHLLPEDPYERAKLRFWASFYDQKLLLPGSSPVIKSEGEEQKNAIQEFFERLGMIEECFEKNFPQRSPFIHGEIPGYLDIVMGCSACNHKAVEEVIGLPVIDSQKHPLFLHWVNAMKENPLGKEILPPHDSYVERLRTLRAKAPHQPRA